MTPAWCVDRLLEAWNPPGGVWLEPSAGDGAIIRAVNARRDDVAWCAVEIRKEERPKLDCRGLDCAVMIGDFISDPWPEMYSNDFSVVIGNPPFSLAMEFVLRSREVAPKAFIAFLLRTNFSGSEDRAAFMQANAPDLKSLPNRPSFRGGGTDSVEYSWFIWPPTPRTLGTFQVLATTPLEVRKGTGQRSLVTTGGV